MMPILCSQEKIALVDDEDFDLVIQFKWTASKQCNTFYPLTRRDNKIFAMHRLIMGFPEKQVDHINGNGLDNRKTNLRLCTKTENGRHSRIRKDNKSGFKGVSWDKRKKKYNSIIQVDGKIYHLGFFDLKEDAAHAYDEAARELFGEFAKLNFPEEIENEQANTTNANVAAGA